MPGSKAQASPGGACPGTDGFLPIVKLVKLPSNETQREQEQGAGRDEHHVGGADCQGVPQHHHPCPEGAQDEGQRNKEDEVVEALKKLLERLLLVDDLLELRRIRLDQVDRFGHIGQEPDVALLRFRLTFELLDRLDAQVREVDLTLLYLHLMPIKRLVLP